MKRLKEKWIIVAVAIFFYLQRIPVLGGDLKDTQAYKGTSNLLKDVKLLAQGLGTSYAGYHLVKLIAKHSNAKDEMEDREFWKRVAVIVTIILAIWLAPPIIKHIAMRYYLVDLSDYI